MINLDFKETCRDFSNDAIQRFIEYENDVYTFVVQYPFHDVPVHRLMFCNPRSGSGMYRMVIEDSGNALISDASLSVINLSNLDDTMRKLNIAKTCANLIRELIDNGLPEPQDA